MTGRGLRSAHTLSSLPVSVPGWDPALSPLSMSCVTCRCRGLSSTGTGPVSGQRSQASGVHQPLHIPCPRACCQTSRLSLRPLPHNAAGQLPCPRGSGQSTGHLLSGCFPSALLSPLPPSSDSSVLPRPIVGPGARVSTSFYVRAVSFPGATLADGTQEAKPAQQQGKIQRCTPHPAYTHRGRLSSAGGRCSHCCLGFHRFKAPSPLPRAPDPEAAAPGKSEP